MKHKIIPAVLIALIAACLLCGSAAAAISGSGTSSNPYVIHDKNDLRLLSGDGYAAYTAAGYFVLDGDDDDYVFTSSDAAFTPIGDNAHKFIGHFDGRNHKITGLRITGNQAGLFAYVSSGASISNIEFHDAQITGNGGSGTGVLYARCYGATSQVTVNNVNVYNSKVTSSGEVVGGIAGYGAQTNSQVIFTSCHVIGCVITSSSGNYVGGIAGFGASTSSQAKFTSCAVKDCVIVSSSGGIVGGIAGYGAATSSQATAQSCNVENCYVYAKTSHAGGIFGYGTYATGTTCTITNCNVLKTTIRADTSYAGGIYGSYRNNGGQPTVSGCTVTDCTVLTAANGGGVAGGYSSG